MISTTPHINGDITMHGLSLSISTLLLALLLVAGGSSHAVALAIQQTQQRSFLGQMLGLSTGGDVLSPSTTLVSPDSVPVEMCPGVSGSFSLESVRTVPYVWNGCPMVLSCLTVVVLSRCVTVSSCHSFALLLSLPLALFSATHRNAARNYA